MEHWHKQKSEGDEEALKCEKEVVHDKEAASEGYKKRRKKKRIPYQESQEWYQGWLRKI